MKTIAVVLSLLVLVAIVQDVYGWPNPGRGLSGRRGEGREQHRDGERQGQGQGQGRRGEGGEQRPDGDRHRQGLNGDEWGPHPDFVGPVNGGIEFEPQLPRQQQDAGRLERADPGNRGNDPARADRSDGDGRQDRKHSQHHKRAGKLPVCNLAVRRPNVTDPFVLCTAECPNNTECTPSVRTPNFTQVSFCLPMLCNDTTQCVEGTTCFSRRNETIQRCYRNRTHESHEESGESPESRESRESAEDSDDSLGVASEEDINDDNESVESSEDLQQCTRRFKHMMKTFGKGRNGNSERSHHRNKQRQRNL